MATVNTIEYKTVEIRPGMEVHVRVVLLDEELLPFNVSGLIDTIEEAAVDLAEDIMHMEPS